MTIKEIAEKFNISVATVSKALNGSNDIADETKKTVCDYAESVGYRSRKSMMINGRVAVLWGKGEKKDGANYEVYRAFRETAERARYVVIPDVVTDDFRLNDYLAYNHLYGALLLDINFNSPVYSQLKKARYPIVLFDNYVTGNDKVSGIGSDNIHSIEEAVDYLVSLDHKGIAFLGGERASLVGAERLAGYVLGLARNSIEYRYDLTYFGDYSMKAGADAADNFLQNKKEFSAIVCASDSMAIGFIDRMRGAGKKIPEDYSVIGYDDLKTVRNAEYNLSTVRQDFDLIGERAFHILESTMKGLSAQRATVGCTLITRGSTQQKQ